MNVQVSPNFRKYGKKSITSIIFFSFVYLALLLSAVALTVACVAGGIYIIVLRPMIFTFMVGIGLGSIGFMVLFFLIKFIFIRNKTDRSHLREIKRTEYPQLFHMIDEIVAEVESPSPKKVYLSTEVNASVFYDSSFWSMFFPIRKNLQIGVGLINAVTQQELKAILAHEFGHFSQKSMKVGSYVYNVNQIIYNMLYNNTGFESMIQNWSNASGYFAFFTSLAVRIIVGIQWVLKKMYTYININYMALSREMEFHADEIAANVAGSQALKHSLLRLEFANFALDSVFTFYDAKIPDNIRSQNIFSEQARVMEYLGKENNYRFEHDLPHITMEDTTKYNKSKLNIKDQWASHPSMQERAAALDKLNIHKENTVNSPAFLLLEEREQLSETITKQLFDRVSYSDVTSTLSHDEFMEQFCKKHQRNTFQKIYNGFYDYNNPLVEDAEAGTEPESGYTPEELFSTARANTTYELVALENDKATLESLLQEVHTIKTFDYDHAKYTLDDIPQLIERINQEIEEKKAEIIRYNKNVYRFFIKKAEETGQAAVLKKKYNDFYKLDQLFNNKYDFYKQLIEDTKFTFQQTPFEEITARLSDLSRKEVRLREEIKTLLENPMIREEFSAKTLETLEKYSSADEMSYFDGVTYSDENLDLLMNSIILYSSLISFEYFAAKKELLDLQYSFMDQNNKTPQLHDSIDSL